MTEADNVLFTTLTMNTQSLHLDAAWSAGTEFGERLVNSMFTLSTLVGLSVAQLTQGTIVANLGFSEVSFPKPVLHGDTLYAETVCTDKRESKSRPGEGIVTLEHGSTRAWMPTLPFPTLMPGIAIRLGIDEQAFAGCSLYIFAQVLQRYFALNSQLNCFSQLTLLSQRSGEELIRCPERSADATPA